MSLIERDEKGSVIFKTPFIAAAVLEPSDTGEKKFHYV